MRVRWTTDAADDLEGICDYIAESRREPARLLRGPRYGCGHRCAPMQDSQYHYVFLTNFVDCDEREWRKGNLSRAMDATSNRSFVLYERAA
jgi:hypothetical protein